MTHKIEKHGLVTRLEQMERLYQRQARLIRWMKVALVVLPIVNLIGGAAFQNQHLAAKTVTAQRFVVKSEDGKLKASLQAEATETSFKMFTEDEKLALAIRLQHNGMVSSYQFYPTGKPSFGFVTTPDGISSFALRRPDGKLLITMNGEATGTLPSVEIGDGRQKLRLIDGK
jgi:hypothetical protein